ncbi:MAG: methyltransferase domain-containing protein [Alphaproteobacteria bacterium]|nr:methyltransferase domain-containing protein [Alphaproteobacteria bacterium]
MLTKTSRARDRKPVSMSSMPLEVIDFGCGSGRSLAFAATLQPGRCMGVDRAEAAVETCRARGYEAEIADILDFSERNIATASFLIDVAPTLGGRDEFEAGLVNVIRAARNYAIIQHPCFDEDAQLIREGWYIEASFAKSLRFKPTTADYALFVQRNWSGLSLSGLAVFGFGKADAVPLGQAAGEHPMGGGPDVHRSLRVIIGRKDKTRFEAAVKRAATGRLLYLWDREHERDGAPARTAGAVGA